MRELGAWPGSRGEGTPEKETERVENTKLADTGHNLISTVRGGQLCSVICHGSPFTLQWLD